MKKFFIILVCVAMIFGIMGCRQSEIVSRNISKEADAFNVTRKLTVINARTDTIMLELIGTFSIETDHNNDELNIICEVGPGQYQKHFVYLNEYTLYVVEDISNTHVDKYHYELNILPLLYAPQITLDITD